jgi:hypothetical protein
MAEYIYTRDLLPDGEWDINNPNRVDGQGDQIMLAYEIAQAIPAITHIDLVCVDAEAKVTTDPDLTPEQKTTMDTVVANHKANT